MDERMKEVQTMNQLDVGLDEMIVRPKRQDRYNNAITDGGVAPPPLLLTIVMMSSNLKSLRISRNFKD